jgi:hypothetical protein
MCMVFLLKGGIKNSYKLTENRKITKSQCGCDRNWEILGADHINKIGLVVANIC